MNLTKITESDEYQEEYQPPMIEVVEIAIEQNILGGSGDAPDFYGEDY